MPQLKYHIPFGAMCQFIRKPVVFEDESNKAVANNIHYDTHLSSCNEIYVALASSTDDLL